MKIPNLLIMYAIQNHRQNLNSFVPLKEFWKIYTLQAELPHRIHTKMKLFPYYVNWIVWSLGISYIQMPSLANNTSRTKHCAKSLVHWSDWSDMVWKVALCCEFSSFHHYRVLKFLTASSALAVLGTTLMAGKTFRSKTLKMFKKGS